MKVGPNPMICIFIRRENNTHRETNRGEGYEKPEAETGVKH